MSLLSQNIREIPEKINSYLIISLLFFIPFSTAMGSILSGLIFILWLLHADYKNQFLQLKHNKVAVASLLFFSLHIVGLLWTADINWGLYVAKKEWKFLILPIFMLYARKEHIRYYIYAFVLAMSISELISYGIWFEIMPVFGDATIYNPTPFMTHITYNPLLAIAIYLIASDILFHKSHSNFKKAIYLLFLITMTVNMFITGGRSGQIMFFVVVMVLAFQYYQISFAKKMSISLIFSLTIFSFAYYSSQIFHDRVNLAVNNFIHYDSNQNSSLGKRISFLNNGLMVFYDNPLIGVGTGDLPNEMEKMHKMNTPKVKHPDNPHNMYVMMAVQFGLLGLIAIAWLFYTQIRYALNNNNAFLRRFGVALPVLFLVANLGESYFSVHATSLLFCTLSAVVYREYSKDSL